MLSDKYFVLSFRHLPFLLYCTKKNTPARICRRMHSRADILIVFCSLVHFWVPPDFNIQLKKNALLIPGERRHKLLAK